MGWYFPPGAEIPGVRECEREIYGAMVEKCAFNSPWNGGAINVKEVPKINSDGEAVDERLGRFLFAPESLTLT